VTLGVRKLRLENDDPVYANLTKHKDREAWLKARVGAIGGSEVAIVLGVSKWGSPYKLWASKTGLIEDRKDDTEILEFGRLVEPLIAKKYAEKTGRKLINLGETTMRRSPQYPWLQVTHDYMIAAGVEGHDGPGVLSIKSVNPWDEGEWLEAEAPLKYQVQLQAELAASGCSWGSFAFLAWGQPMQWFDQKRDDKFIAMMDRECSKFWRGVVEGIAPEIDGSDHTASAIKLRYPGEIEGKVVALPDDAAAWSDELERLAEERKTIEGREEELKNKLRAAIGDAEIGECPAGGPVWTFKKSAKAAHFVKESVSRVLRRKKGKKEKTK
jgi:putative phage-type endonuclease